MLPALVRFLALTNFTSGLEDVWPGFQDAVDGVGLVTSGALSTEGWSEFEPVTSTWTDVYAAPSTTWTVVEP